jgi:hypothetical protein
MPLQALRQSMLPEEGVLSPAGRAQGLYLPGRTAGVQEPLLS